MQVLSDSVSKALSLTGGVEASETAYFVGMMDKFFDCVNVHNCTHCVKSQKTFQMPYTSVKVCLSNIDVYCYVVHFVTVD